jgi:hypothetical protein
MTAVATPRDPTGPTGEAGATDVAPPRDLPGCEQRISSRTGVLRACAPLRLRVALTRFRVRPQVVAEPHARRRSVPEPDDAGVERADNRATTVDASRRS